MTKLSVVILTRNEENNILDCIETASFADEIIVIDDYSDDRTIEIVKNIKRRNIRVFTNHLNQDFSKQRNFGLSVVKNEWVLFLDADERISEDLAKEIRASVEEDRYDGFLLRRSDVIWGRKLSHGESADVELLRLARRESGKWKRRVHEVWDVKGRVGKLKNDLIHYPHQSVAEFLHEINVYSSIRAEELKQEGIKPSFLDIIIYPKAKFFLNYFLRLGFLDGIQGLIVALMMSFHSFLVRGKLWLLQNER